MLQEQRTIGFDDGVLHAPLSLLIEGWRGINHSFSLVNQHQILNLLDISGLTLFHKDLPFAFGHWTRLANSAGFSSEHQQRIDALPEPDATPLDCTFRICSPALTEAPSSARKVVTFLATEVGLSQADFLHGVCNHENLIAGENAIVTPTHWARACIIDYGFPPEKVHVVAHGVDSSVFYPLGEEERAQSRAALGFADDEFVFLTIGTVAWNKGLDLILKAFAALRSGGHNIRLIWKDQRDVYGLSADDIFREVGTECPALLEGHVSQAISVIPMNLDTSQLRRLYGLADCYLTPYRGEGFNLPALEAIACGTPVIATRGGATDDFCNDVVATRISGRLNLFENPAKSYKGRAIEPDFDELVEAMRNVARASGSKLPNFANARQEIVERFTWRRSATELLKVVST